MWYRFMCEISTARNNGLMSRANETWGICSPFSRPDTSGSGFVACVKTKFHLRWAYLIHPAAPSHAADPGRETRQTDRRAAQPCLSRFGRVHRKEISDNVVGPCPAIVRKARRAACGAVFVVGDQ